MQVEVAEVMVAVQLEVPLGVVLVKQDQSVVVQEASLLLRQEEAVVQEVILAHLVIVQKRERSVLVYKII